MTEDTRGLKTSEEPEPTENTEAIDTDTDTDTEPDDSVTAASGDDEAAADAPADEDDEAAADATDEEADEDDSDAEAEADADSDAKVDAKAEAKAAKAETKATKPKPKPTPTPKARANRPRRDLWRWTRNLKPVPVILVLLLVISGGVAIWLYYNQYRPDQKIDPSAERAAVTAASDGTVALLSYSPDTLDKDFATARSHLAGDFLSYYNQFTEQIVAPAAKQKSLKTTAHVMRAGISEMHADSAVVLLFVDQSTTSKDNPDPAMSASSVQVTVTRVDGQWLITKFTPV